MRTHLILRRLFDQAIKSDNHIELTEIGKRYNEFGKKNEFDKLIESYPRAKEMIDLMDLINPPFPKK